MIDCLLSFIRLLIKCIYNVFKIFSFLVNMLQKNFKACHTSLFMLTGRISSDIYFIFILFLWCFIDVEVTASQKSSLLSLAATVTCSSIVIQLSYSSLVMSSSCMFSSKHSSTVTPLMNLLHVKQFVMAFSDT